MAPLRDLVRYRDEILGPMQFAVQLGSFRVITATRARVSSQNFSKKVGKTEYVFESLGRISFDQLKSDFQMWVFTSVISDLVDAFSEMLTKLAVEANQLKGGSLKLDPGRIEKMGIKAQLGRFQSAGFKIAPEWTDMLESYNVLRNCVVHGGGQVRERDCNREDKLVVCWMKPAVGVQSDDLPNAFSGLVSFRHIAGDPKFLGGVHLVKKCFAVGETIEISLGDVLEICGTFQVLSATVRSLNE